METVKKSNVKELNEETKEFLKNFSTMFASISHLSIPEQRATINETFHIREENLEPISSVDNVVVTGKNGPINLRLFTPKNDGPLPIIIYFHRGGWVYGSLEESEGICRRLSNETGSIVAAVDYRLSPEHKFPVPLEDCYDATKWIVENATFFKVSGDPKKVIISGESAGGNLAAAVSLMARDKNEFSVTAQLLIYPILKSDLEITHYDASPDKSLLSYENMEFFLSAYLASDADGENPYVSPLKSDDFSKLPPCFIITAENDALKHEGADYADKLKRAGISVLLKCYPEVIHGFLDLPLSESTKKKAIGDIAEWVNRF